MKLVRSVRWRVFHGASAFAFVGEADTDSDTDSQADLNADLPCCHQTTGPFFMLAPKVPQRVWGKSNSSPQVAAKCVLDFSDQILSNFEFAVGGGDTGARE